MEVPTGPQREVLNHEQVDPQRFAHLVLAAVVQPAGPEPRQEPVAAGTTIMPEGALLNAHRSFAPGDQRRWSAGTGTTRTCSGSPTG